MRRRTTGNSDFPLIRLLQTPLSIHRPPTGVVMDTVCHRPTNHDPKQTLENTNTSYLVKGALGKAKTLNQHTWMVLSWDVK